MPSSSDYTLQVSNIPRHLPCTEDDLKQLLEENWKIQ